MHGTLSAAGTPASRGVGPWRPVPGKFTVGSRNSGLADVGSAGELVNLPGGDGFLHSRHECAWMAGDDMKSSKFQYDGGRPLEEKASGYDLWVADMKKYKRSNYSKSPTR